MRGLNDKDPIAVCVYFAAVIGCVMFTDDPILILSALIGGSLYCVAAKRQRGHMWFYVLMFLIMTLINPIFSHNGMTVLFFVNDTPITLEATVYGAVRAICIVTSLYLFMIFSDIMTRDKLLYVLGRLSPQAALVMSMSIRYVALLRDRAKKIKDAQRAIGLYADGDIFCRIKGDLRVFSILVTWALENGITTADSMEARGYGSGKRTYYSMFRMRADDVIFMILSLFCLSLVIAASVMGKIEFRFYPKLSMMGPSYLGMAAYSAFFALCVTPAFIEVKERIKWTYLRSRI